MFALSWRVMQQNGREASMYLADPVKMWAPEITQVSILSKALVFDSIYDAESAAVLYGAQCPELLGRFQVVKIKFRDEGYGKMVPYGEAV